MSQLEWLAALSGFAALTAYVVLGGADFGGGMWYALASGPRAQAQREAVSRAMGPVWEVNHVWLIFAIVTAWTCFPAAFATIYTLLAIPLILALAGIIVRGAAFAFREQARTAGTTEIPFGAAFGVASLLTPMFFGLGVASLASGAAWWGLFSWSVAALAVSACALLAAVYLTVETTGGVQEDFRRRALVALGITAICAVVALVPGTTEAPRLAAALMHGVATPFAIGAGVLAALVALLLVVRRFAGARAAVIGFVVCVLWGWGVAQYPYAVVPTLRLHDAASPPQTLLLYAIGTAVGMVVLLPSLWLLFRVFKGDPQIA